MTKRHDGRSAKELRKIKITKDYTKFADGSCLIEFGDTRVLCTAIMEEVCASFSEEFRKGVGDSGIWNAAGVLSVSDSSR